MRPEEVEPFFAHYGLTMSALLSVQGIVPDLQRQLSELAESNPVAYQAALEVILHTASDPSILGMANHLLYIGRKS